MKILDYTKKGLTKQEIANIRYALLLQVFEEKEKSLNHEDYKVEYWNHVIPNVHNDIVKVVRVS